MKTRILLLGMSLMSALVGCSGRNAGPRAELYPARDYFTLAGRADDHTKLPGTSARHFYLMHPEELNLKAPAIDRAPASAMLLPPVYEFKAFRFMDGN